MGLIRLMFKTNVCSCINMSYAVFKHDGRSTHMYLTCVRMQNISISSPRGQLIATWPHISKVTYITLQSSV